MNTIVIPTAQNIELEYPQAGLGERILAFIIDAVVLGAYVWLLAMLDVYSQAGEIIFTFLIPAMCYSLFCEITFNGQTLGKYFLKIRVISLDGAAPSISQYLLRWMIKLIDVWVLYGIVGIITIAINKKGQRLGDMAAGTTVIRLKLVTHFADTIFMETGEDYEVSFPQIRNLSDRDVSILKEVLDAGIRSSNPDLLYRLAEKVKQVAGIETEMKPRPFLEKVLQDYNHLFGGE
jgi:uncharacterized RDD family membrane protein YckC